MKLTKEELKQQAKIANEHAKELEKEIEKIEAEERDRELDDLKPLAIKAHDLLCSYNHCDGCGWSYEIKNGVHNWKYGAHDRWLSMIAKIVMGEPKDRWSKGSEPVSAELLEKILDKVEEIKKLDPQAWFILQTRLK